MMKLEDLLLMLKDLAQKYANNPKVENPVMLAMHAFLHVRVNLFRVHIHTHVHVCANVRMYLGISMLCVYVYVHVLT